MAPRSQPGSSRCGEEPSRSTLLCPACSRGPLPGALRAALARGHCGFGSHGGRAVRAACHRCVYDEPPARKPLSLSLLGLTCRSCGQKDPLPRALTPGQCQEGPSGETGGEGRGPALSFERATGHCPAPTSPSAPETGRVPARQSLGGPRESLAGTEVLVPRAGVWGGSCRCPRRTAHF